MDNANAGPRRGFCSFLPLLADLGEKTLAGSTVLAQKFFATVAVVADRRSGNQHSWRLRRFCQRLRQVACSQHAAVADRSFLLRAPASDNRFPGEMHDGIKSRDRIR